MFEALEMFYEAERDRDPLRLACALKHLEFLRDLQMLNTQRYAVSEPSCP